MTNTPVPTTWIPLNDDAGTVTADNSGVQRIEQDGTQRIEQDGTQRVLNDNALAPKTPIEWTD